MSIFDVLSILAKQTGGFTAGCKINVQSTDVLFSFRPTGENSSPRFKGGAQLL
jgi:hypothetical protein